MYRNGVVWATSHGNVIPFAGCWMPYLLATGRIEGRGTRYNHVSKVCFSPRKWSVTIIKGCHFRRAQATRSVTAPLCLASSNRLLSITGKNGVRRSGSIKSNECDITMWMKAPLLTRSTPLYLSQVCPPLLGDLQQWKLSGRWQVHVGPIFASNSVPCAPCPFTAVV